MLTELKKCLKNELNDPEIFDIVIYGSVVKGESRPNDLDLVVIFRSGTLKERLNKVQQIKSKLKFPLRIDLKGILWEELFQEEFFARSGIFGEGISIATGQSFARRIGFSNSVQFIYELKDKSHSDKVKFNYVLSGRKNAGMIKKLGGKRLTSGVVEIPVEHSHDFENILKMHKITFIKRSILISD